MKKYLSILLVLVFVFSSCSKGGGKGENTNPEIPDTPIVPPTPDDPTTKVSFSPSIVAFSRMAGDAFEASDEISVYAVKMDATNTTGILSSANFADNLRYVYRSPKFEAFNKAVTYPDKSTTLAFHAIYPYSSGYSVPEFLFAVNKDQSNESNYMQSDLLTAVSKSAANATVPLTFNHRLSKIVVNLVLKGVAANGLSVSFSNLCLSAKANLNNTTFQGTGTKGSIVPAENGSLSYKLILPPQALAKDMELATITIAGTRYIWNYSANRELASGMEYSYDLEISASEDEGKVVVISSSIHPWGNEEEEAQL